MNRTKMNWAGSAGIAFTVIISFSNVQGQPTKSIHPTPIIPGMAPTPARTPVASIDKESSLTVQQIVARQEDNFARIRTAQGTAVYTNITCEANGNPGTPQSEYIFFAYDADRSVTLAMPTAAAQLYKANQGKVAWEQVTSAYHIAGDAVYAIRKPASAGAAPEVLATAFNPAVHENNPLIRFHPRQISDEQMPLRDLVRAIPSMAERPKVYDEIRNGKQLARIEFSNANTPGERLTYVIDTQRGYLPIEILHVSHSKPVSVSKIVIGSTPDGTWIPARRERTVYNTAGKPAGQQLWHYDYLGVNKELAAQALSLMFFNLPLDTPVKVIGAKNMRTTGTQLQSPQASPATQNPAVIPRTPLSARVAPAPQLVPLR